MFYHVKGSTPKRKDQPTPVTNVLADDIIQHVPSPKKSQAVIYRKQPSTKAVLNTKWALKSPYCLNNNILHLLNELRAK